MKSFFATLQSLELVSRYIPLGIRFWDPAADMPVVEDLEVTAMPHDRPDLSGRAEITPSGVFAFHRLPGMRALEVSDPKLPAGVHPLNASPPFSGRFLISVRDRRERFQPCLFFIDLPYQGIYPTQPTNSPPRGLPGFYLFSAPTRNPVASLSLVRAQLVERLSVNKSRPAAFAVLEVQPPTGPTWPGIADKRGSVVVFLPQPAFSPAPPETSPLTPPPSPTRTVSWDLIVRVRYATPPLDPVEGFGVPLLRDVFNQPLAHLYTDLDAPGQPISELSTHLTLGQHTLVQTKSRSELWIES
jgi:hypothetical protein